jgi:hypothetical protein
LHVKNRSGIAAFAHIDQQAQAIGRQEKFSKIIHVCERVTPKTAVEILSQVSTRKSSDAA